MTLPRVAVVSDFLEERWASMDLVAEMLVTHLGREHSATVEVCQLQPRMASWMRGLPLGGSSRVAYNIDRFIGRYWDYPRSLGQVKKKFDIFHIVDHSYAQLVHQLPADRCVVTCHDLDAFRSVLRPDVERRSWMFRCLMRHVLRGLRGAAKLTCDSESTRQEVLAYELCSPERVVVVPNGVDTVFSSRPEPNCDAAADRLLGARNSGAVEILHVGSTVPRKRIDVLLHAFASLRKEFPQARLVRVGGPFTAEQEALVSRLGLNGAVAILPVLSREVLAAVYRRALVVVQPSEREGFGLPVLEAMACGTPVVASDLAVLREVGDGAVTYCPVADISAWNTAVGQLLLEHEREPEEWIGRRELGIRQASKFSWTEYARKMVEVYRELLGA